MNSRKSKELRAVARQLTTSFKPIKQHQALNKKGKLTLTSFIWPEGTFRWVLKKLKRKLV